MITIDNLIQRCLNNNETPKQFRILYNQLTHRCHIEPIELFDSLQQSLHYYYILEIFNYEIGISKLFDIIKDRDLVEQATFVKLLTQEPNIINDADLEVNFVKYLKTILAQPANSTGDESDQNLEDLIVDLSAFITAHGINIGQDLSNQFLELAPSLKSSAFLKQDASSSNKNVNLYKLIRIKKFVWLNYQVLNYKFQDTGDEFINDFIKLIYNSSMNYVSTELLSSAFECMNVAELGEEIIIRLNWQFFIVNRLPLIFQSSLKINQENFEIILDKSLPLLTNFNIKSEFLKSLVSLKLIKLEKFYHFIGTTDNVIELNELLKYQNDSIREYAKLQEFNFIQDTINKNLVEVNPEFTTLDEENKLFIFMNKLQLNHASVKKEFSKIVTKTITTLCDEKDSRRLRRLLISISSNFDTLDTVVFHSDPNLILQKLIEICGNSDYLNESSSREDVSMFGDDDDDDENYQELYTDFSCILLHIMVVSRRYHLEIPPKNLFIVKLMQELHNLSCKTYSETSSKILPEWYNSIYNDNESLISDDLIAKTNLIHAFQVIPIAFNNSLISHYNRHISLDLVMNGFEFFMQPFLIVNLIPIFFMINEFLWLNNSLEVIWKICNKILNFNLTGESKFMFDLIWKYVSCDIQHWKDFGVENCQDYTDVIALIRPMQPPRQGGKFHCNFLQNLNALNNWNVNEMLLTSIWEDIITTERDFYCIFREVAANVAKLCNYSADALKDVKNLALVNYLESASFTLLIIFKFEKVHLKNLNNFLNGEPFQDAPNKIFYDLRYLAQTLQGFELQALHKVLERVVQQLSSL